jgi:hypothetical protein
MPCKGMMLTQRHQGSAVCPDREINLVKAQHAAFIAHVQNLHAFPVLLEFLSGRSSLIVGRLEGVHRKVEGRNGDRSLPFPPVPLYAASWVYLIGCTAGAPGCN